LRGSILFGNCSSSHKHSFGAFVIALQIVEPAQLVLADRRLQGGFDLVLSQLPVPSAPVVRSLHRTLRLLGAFARAEHLPEAAFLHW
jgi:hypothetical protein